MRRIKEMNRLPTNKELGIKPTKRQKDLADRIVANACVDSLRTEETHGRKVFAVCPECGGNVGIKECRSAAYPRASPFLRMVCDGCGWFGNTRDYRL